MEDLSRHFSKEGIQMARKHKKRCSNTTIREIQIKTTMRYHFTSARMAIIKTSTDDTCWRGCGEKRTLLYCWLECKWVQPLWENSNRVLIELLHPTPGHVSGENRNSKRYIHPNVHCSTIYNCQEMETI